jgi:hypothetical protein
MTMPLPMRQQQAVHQGPRAPRPATCALLWQTGQLGGRPCRSYPTWALSCTMAQWRWLAASGKALGSAMCEFQRSQCFAAVHAAHLYPRLKGRSSASAPDHPLEAHYGPHVESANSMCSLQERKDAGTGGVEVLIPRHASPWPMKPSDLTRLAGRPLGEPLACCSAKGVLPEGHRRATSGAIEMDISTVMHAHIRLSPTNRMCRSRIHACMRSLRKCARSWDPMSCHPSRDGSTSSFRKARHSTLCMLLRLRLG